VARLIYSAITSLDGYVADQEGTFGWAAPSEEVFTFVNDLLRPVGTFLFGRRMYDVMVAWETMQVAGQPAAVADFAKIWHASDKIVFSRALRTAPSARTRVTRDFDPESVRRMKATVEGDLSVGGPELAAQALMAGLVDEVHLFLTPVVVGSGTASFPQGLRVKLQLVGERRFSDGVVYLSYRPTTSNLFQDLK